MKTALQKKPMYVGLDFVRDKNWNPILFYYPGAFVYMEKHRVKMPERKSFCSVISEFDGYFRGSYAGQPVNLLTGNVGL